VYFSSAIFTVPSLAALTVLVVMVSSDIGALLATRNISGSTAPPASSD
jgi:hypothetical protein